jgi:putative thioredoxin
MTPSTSFVFEVTAANFKRDVLERSRKTPVVLDFWASWCGPCKTLGPLLERLAEEARGGFQLGKVNTETEQALAYQFGVQSIPFVVAMVDGKPVDAFVGALPETEVRAFLKAVGIGAAPPQEAPPELDPSTPEGSFAAAVKAVREGRFDEAGPALARISEEHDLYAPAERIRQAMEFFALTGPPGEGPAAAGLAAAAAAFQAGRQREALQELLGSVQEDRGFRDGLARRAMVAIFTVLGESDPLTDEYRRLLTQALY